MNEFKVGDEGINAKGEKVTIIATDYGTKLMSRNEGGYEVTIHADGSTLFEITNPWRVVSKTQLIQEET